MRVEDRVVGLRRIPAGDLIDNPANWRTHPDEQVAALSTVLENIGFADVAIGIETGRAKPRKVMLIDGHLRKNIIDDDQEIPVLILDLTPEEAELLLATLDPLAGMANTNPAALSSIIERLVGDDPAIDSLLRTVSEQVDLEKLISDEEPTNPKPKTTRIDATRVCPECGYEWND